jgi:transcriptional regulator with XRE-family HTH domain
MPKPVRKSQFKPIPEEDRQIGIRMMYLRKMKNRSQAQLADLLQSTRDAIANIEIGRVPLRLNMGWQVCRLFDVHPSWLCVGHWPLGGEQPFPPSDHPNLPRIEQLVTAFGDKPFFEGFAAIGWLLTADGLALAEREKKKVLTTSSELRNIDAMKMRELLEKVRRLTAPRGMKAALARALPEPLPRISEWLAGKYEPSGETTLRLLNWVEQQESHQQQSPGSVPPPSGPKAQSQESNEKKKPRSNPSKR